MNYNKSQQQAIRHKDGPMLVLAGPGSGKTAVITQRTKQLIEYENIDPSNILVITFTRAAAQEMKQRFLALTGEERTKVTFGTFHAIFFMVLKLAYHFDSGNIISEEQRYQFMREILSYHHLEYRDEGEFIGDVLTEISRVKNEQIPLEHFYSSSCGEEVFRKIYREYDERLKRNRLIDFDDMLTYTYDLFSQRKDILSAWQKKYRYILIDEFQDINLIQWKIMCMLAAPENNLFVVGDDDQSIYHFRGARPEIMLNFTKDYPKAETVLLNVNYRCSKNILRTAMEVIGCNTRRFKKQLDTPNEEGMPVTCKEFDNPREEYMCVVAALKKRMERGEDLLNTAILLRTNQESEGLINVLMEYQVPFTMKEQLPNLFRHWICRALLAYLEMAAGDRSRKNFLEIMNRPNRYISREALNSSQINFNELREYYKDKDWMCDRITTLETHLRILGTLSPFAAINFIRKGMGFEEYLREYAQYRKIKPEELLETLDRIHESAKGMKTLAKWQAYIEEYTKRLNEQARKQQDKKEGVTISTLHAVKGLEYDIVYILNVNEGSIPYRKAVLAEAVEEERRLFYVGMTRAKKKLVLAYVKRQYEKEREPSRFLEETGL
jgi:DNA helicase-2/ATP-dependent DNA helicase PcrA